MKTTRCYPTSYETTRQRDAVELDDPLEPYRAKLAAERREVVLAAVELAAVFAAWWHLTN